MPQKKENESTRIRLHIDFVRELLVPLSTFICDIRDLEVMFCELATALDMKQIILYKANETGFFDTMCWYGPSTIYVRGKKMVSNINLYIAWKTGKISSLPLPKFGDNIVIPVGIDGLFLAAGDNRHSREVTKIENALFELCAGIVANALRSMKLIDQANTDKLTGLKNRSALDKYIYEWKNPFDKIIPDPIALCMLDIDFFKRFNDTFWHHVWDQVLKHVAAVCEEYLWSKNQAYRFGWEELTFIIHSLDDSSLYDYVDWLRLVLEKTPLNYDNVSYPITASIWIYEFAEKDTRIKDAKFFSLKYADKALFRAKETGRNKVCIYDESIERRKR